MVTQHLDEQEQERQPLLQSSRSHDSNDHSSSQPRKQPNTSYSVHDLEEEEEEEEGAGAPTTPSLDESVRLAFIQALPWYKRPSLVWLLPFVFLLALILGVTQAPQDQMIIKIICKDHLQNTTTLPSVSSLSIPRYKGEIDINADTTTTPSDVISSYDFSFWNRNRTEERRRYDENPCNAAPVQAYGALVLSRIRSLKYVTAIFTVGFYTSMSDRHGRKSLVFWTLIPALLTQVLIIYMAHPTVNLGVWVLYVDALLMGLSGGGLLLDPAMTAYIADCTPTKGRSLAIGYVMVSLSVGIMVGPIIGSMIYNWSHEESTAMYVSIATLIFLTFYASVMPESFPKELRSKVEPKSGEEVVAKERLPVLKTLQNGIMDALDPLMLFLPGKVDTTVDGVKLLPSKFTLAVMVLIYGLLQFALSGTTIMTIPFTNLVFHWTTYEDGFYFAFIGCSSFVVYVVIFPGLQKLKAHHFKEKDVKINNAEAAPLPPAPVDQITGLDLGTAESQYLSEQTASDESTAAEMTKDSATERLASVRNDLSFVIFGAVAYCLAYLIVPVFKTEFILFVASFVRALGSVAIPSFASMVTTIVRPDQIGKANEALRRMLEDHWDKQHSGIESNQDHSMEVSTSDSVSFPETTLAKSEDAPMENPPVALKLEDKTTLKAEDERDASTMADPEEISVKLEVTDAPTTPPKTEEQDLVKTELLESGGEDQKRELGDDEMEVEKDQHNNSRHDQLEQMVEVKMEEETLIKEENEDALIEPKQEDKDDMEIEPKEEPVKQEENVEPSRPVSTRTKLWEAKTSMTASRTTTTSRSALPVSSAKLNKVLNRSAKPGEPKTEEKGEADVLPASGTVRALVSRFAGSTANKPPGSPISKQKTGGMSSIASTTNVSKSSPKPRAAVPMIPRYKRVIKVPVASSLTSGKSVYAMPPSGAPSSANTSSYLAGTKRKAGASDSSVEDSAGLAVPAQKRTVVSVATINRLATPKKAKLSPPPSGLGSAVGPSGSSSTISPPSSSNSSSSATTAPPTTPTRPTRARGPVLSTASRAAQRQSRQRP
ncbi:hypothetical protein EMPS_04622 [Entomortierella parvispora]|uniref:Major facilitator superfamily (MFS) profile domain-containing protein n=1 Tax=Entomortierella parvispora TaxID=205924 RepID=A0A9P3LVZ9_9FUNG|nr:hypothetical protein EMPS_04622 [Entomortierella parvispora]